MDELTHKEFSKRGGDKTYKKYGRKFLSEIGKKGAKTNLKRYGTEYFKKLSELGVAARKAKKDASRSVVEKIKDAILPASNSTE